MQPAISARHSACNTQRLEHVPVSRNPPLPQPSKYLQISKWYSCTVVSFVFRQNGRHMKLTTNYGFHKSTFKVLQNLVSTSKSQC